MGMRIELGLCSLFEKLLVDGKKMKKKAYQGLFVKLLALKWCVCCRYHGSRSTHVAYSPIIVVGVLLGGSVVVVSVLAMMWRGSSWWLMAIAGGCGEVVR